MAETNVGRAVLLLSLATMAGSASLRATDPLLARLALDFNTTPGTAADATTAFFLGYGLLQFIHGPVGDRFGKFRVIAVQSALAACATLLCAVAPTLEALVAARFFAGLFVGAVIPLSFAWVGDAIPYAGRQAVLARVMLGQVAGVTAGLAAGGWFAEHMSWRWSFVSIAVLYAGVSLLLAVDLYRNPLHRHLAGDGAPKKRVHALTLVRDPWVRIMILAVFIEAMLAFAALGFIPLHLHRSLGLDLAASGLLVTVSAVGGLIYAMTAGRMVRYLGERGLVRYGGIGYGAGIVVLALVPSTPVAVVALLAMGLGIYVMHGTLQVHATQMAPDARGAGVSTFAFFLFAGQSLGVWLGSLVVDRAGTAPILVVAGVGVWLLSIFLRRQLVEHARVLVEDARVLVEHARVSASKAR